MHDFDLSILDAVADGEAVPIAEVPRRLLPRKSDGKPVHVSTI